MPEMVTYKVMISLTNYGAIRQERTVVKLDNQRDRQTYYGALNLVSQEFIVKPYKAGNGENTVKFVEELKRMNPQQKILLIWDGASYHFLSRNAAATSQRKRR